MDTLTEQEQKRNSSEPSRPPSEPSGTRQNAPEPCLNTFSAVAERVWRLKLALMRLNVDEEIAGVLPEGTPRGAGFI